MKQIPILSGKAHVVELPEINGKWKTVYRNDNDKNGVLISDEKEYYDKWVENSNPRFVFSLPPGNWQIVGMLSEVAEKDIKPLVKYISDWGYINHGVKTQVRETLLKTALESLESAIRAEGWYFENPFGDEPAEDDYSFFTDSNVTLKEAWQQAQSRVLCRERCLILKRN